MSAGNLPPFTIELPEGHAFHSFQAHRAEDGAVQAQHGILTTKFKGTHFVWVWTENQQMMNIVQVPPGPRPAHRRPC